MFQYKAVIYRGHENKIFMNFLMNWELKHICLLILAIINYLYLTY
jgi:hypothetical protein